MTSAKNKRIRGRAARTRNRYRDELELANGCLDMVREELELLGMPMDGCPPMFYNDAIHNIAATLARAAGLKTRDDVRKLLGEKYSGAPHVATGETRPTSGSSGEVGAP